MRTEIDLHRAYRAMLLALSYPGRPQAVADADLLAESSFEPDDPTLARLDGRASAAAIEALPRGSEAEPETGVTCIWQAGSLDPVTRVRLTGPGVKDQLEVELPLTPAQLLARERACATYPMGIDLVIVGAGGSLVGLPRTTRVEIL